MKKELEQNSFFEKYNINKEEFEKANISWDVLLTIYEDHIIQIPTLETAAKTVAEILRIHPDVHTVRSRTKNPQNLIEKIIRKTIRKQEKDVNYQITLENYKKEITDLIGIRVLHLYKDQAFNIDKMIRDYWDLEETATIYYRKGDFNDRNVDESSQEFVFEEHPAGYRSWHYLIKTQLTKIENIAEIQVRTIFEEGWSEIDHQLRYPYELNNDLLNNQLLVLNRLAGSADEMVNTIRATKSRLNNLIEEKDKLESITSSLNEKIKALSADKGNKEELIKSLEVELAELKETQKSTYLTLSSNGLGGYKTDLSGLSYISGKSDIIYTIQQDPLKSLSIEASNVTLKKNE